MQRRFILLSTESARWVRYKSHRVFMFSQSTMPGNNPTAVFALFLLNSSICSAHPSISESSMTVLAVRHPWAFFHASKFFLAIHLSISALITVSLIPVVGSGPVKTSFLACLASRSDISFPFIPVWPGSQKMVSGRLSPSRFILDHSTCATCSILEPSNNIV